MSRTAVVGAGIAGLAAAREIVLAGGDAVVFESDARVGGRIKTVRRGGFTFDSGAFIYLGSYRQATEMMRAVGLEAQMAKVPANGAMPRDGRLHFLDLSKPVRAVAGTRYLSVADKLRLSKLMFQLARHWKDLNYEDASGVAAIDTDTVESWCGRDCDPPRGRHAPCRRCERSTRPRPQALPARRSRTRGRDRNRR